MTCSHLPPIENSKLVKPVTLPSGRARLVTYPAETASGTCTNTIGMDKVCCRTAVTRRRGRRDDHIRPKFDQFLCELRGESCVAFPETRVDPNVAALDPSVLFKPLAEGCGPDRVGTVLCVRRDIRNPPQPLRLLRSRHARPCPPLRQVLQRPRADLVDPIASPSPLLTMRRWRLLLCQATTSHGERECSRMGRSISQGANRRHMHRSKATRSLDRRRPGAPAESPAPAPPPFCC
jgi:hypothetical protein